jgi:hypothetical protein
MPVEACLLLAERSDDATEPYLSPLRGGPTMRSGVGGTRLTPPGALDERATLPVKRRDENVDARDKPGHDEEIGEAQS